VLDDAAREQGIQVHGEIVHGGAAGFRDVFRTRAGLSIEKYSNVTDFQSLFASNFHDAVAGGDRGDDRIEIAS
jgi:hypothetical protein